MYIIVFEPISRIWIFFSYCCLLCKLALHELDELDELDVDNEDNDEGLFFSRLEAAELVIEEDADEFWQLAFSDNNTPLRTCWLTCGYRIRIWSTTSKRFLASIARTCAEDNMPLKISKN